MDLDRYCARVGYTGPRTPTLGTLQALHLRHPTAIAFENLNPLLGWPVPLDDDALGRKMLDDGRGGWCFEQNWLLRRALESMGFQVRGLAARVLWRNPSPAPARTHMLLEVTLDGAAWLADVGFGGLTLTAPLAFEPGREQATPHEPFRLVALDGSDDEWVLEARLDTWVPLYRLCRHEQLLQDYEMSSHYLCTHPSSFFTRELAAARSYDGGRYTLRNATWTHRTTGGVAETRVLASADEVLERLTGDFHLRLPDTPLLRAACGRIVREFAPPAP